MVIEISQEEAILGSEEEMLGDATHFRADLKAVCLQLSSGSFYLFL